ncbi:LuxR family transcriptional regulator [Streptomyces sp. ATCC51928]|uniref:LuxR family transcriptional regulator n=1 Tax=Streptomyces caviscabies TaxID=90079 RepID=A0ABW2M7B9_9ACTN|nr:MULTISPECIES: LuxR family transcriptional regulator [unclassified Streptomyces]MDX3501515.1 LuxR family transcriptional regulator [Streptomyces sp. ATCC51928]MDX5521367.1 LuxR family transcriptional regulator [Streptomyces sp. DE06-01C]
MTSSTTVRSPLRLYGRDAELATLEGLLELLRRGDGGALVLAAPPGLGRTALLRAAAEAHQDRGPVLYATATGAMRAVPGGGLGALLGSVAAGSDPLGPLAAGRAAAGPSPAAPPGADPRGPSAAGPAVTGLPSSARPPAISPDALLGRLRELSVGRPLLVCVDDAHAWDPASRDALALVARGLGPGSRILVLLTATDSTAFAGLPVLQPAPLDEGAAGALLDRLTSGTEGLDPVVRAELLREAAGNPRLLAGLAGRLTPDQLAGRTPLPFPLPGGEAVLAAHAERLDGLPDRTRALLLLAAAAQEHEPDGAGADALLLLRAGTRSGLPRTFLDRALFGTSITGSILQRAGSRVHFTHRLVARAVLHHAPWPHRRAAHELLATLLTEAAPAPPPGTAPASPVPLAALVQRACAAPGPDAVLAARIEAAAVAPFPHAERSAALARAAQLSTEPASRAARFAGAAEQAGLAGDPCLARALLARAGPRTVGAAGPGGDPGQGLAPYVHGMLALRSGPAADAHEALLASAGLLAPHDPRRALDALLGAAEAAWAAGDALGYLDAMNRLARSPVDPDLEHYRAGMCAVLEGRTAKGHALLRPCLDPAGDPGAPAALLRSGVAALVLGDVAAACRAGARALAAVRTRGPEALLPQALEHLAYAELRAGRHAGARAHALEGLHAARRTGQPNSSAHLHAVLALAASVEGPAEACAAHAEAALAGAGPHGLAQAGTLATWARARADLASGRPGEAAARLAPLVGTGPGRGHFAVRTLAVPCWVEAAVLAGRLPEESGELHAAVDEFASWAARTADPGAPAQLARCRALLAPADAADARYAEALDHHGRAGGDFERARTQLLYGQWLRRRRRTREARGPLRDALVAFQRCSARAWAERAAGELRAAGEPVAERRDAPGEPLAALTPQQQRIARCVAEGATNREVALRLSLSPRTVDHHLRNVFAALGIRSRTELARLLSP